MEGRTWYKAGRASMSGRGGGCAEEWSSAWVNSDIYVSVFREADCCGGTVGGI